MNLRLSRPIVFFDLETTGRDFVADRIVQISVLKVCPDSSEESRTRLINPGRPIPKEATTVHGITDDDVQNQPRFRDIARSLFDFLSDCDIAGYNSNAFDIPFLAEEFARCGLQFPQDGTRLIDVCIIFKRKEERTLSAAYRFYCGKMLENAHNAEADVRATYDVFRAQLARYADIGSLSLDELHAYCTRPDTVDYARHLVRNEKGEIVFNFGKHKGEPVTQHPAYVQWMLESEFPEATKMVLRRIRDSLPTS
jgi:DNA polymerase-3 subunit epsilon